MTENEAVIIFAEVCGNTICRKRLGNALLDFPKPDGVYMGIAYEMEIFHFYYPFSACGGFLYTENIISQNEKNDNRKNNKSGRKILRRQTVARKKQIGRHYCRPILPLYICIKPIIQLSQGLFLFQLCVGCHQLFRPDCIKGNLIKQIRAHFTDGKHRSRAERKMTYPVSRRKDVARMGLADA